MLPNYVLYMERILFKYHYLVKFYKIFDFKANKTSSIRLRFRKNPIRNASIMLKFSNSENLKCNFDFEINFSTFIQNVYNCLIKKLQSTSRHHDDSSLFKLLLNNSNYLRRWFTAQ